MVFWFTGCASVRSLLTRFWWVTLWPVLIIFFSSFIVCHRRRGLPWWLQPKYVGIREMNLLTLGRFIYIRDSLNSSSFTFWSSQLACSSRSNWIGISNGTWNDKQSSHFRTAKEIRVKATFFFITTYKFWNDAEMMLKLVICK